MSWWSSVVDYIFGRGKHVPRKGPAHSSDRNGIFKALWKVRKLLNINPDHSGSVDIYDHFGCAPYNDNDIKRERRDAYRYVLEPIAHLDGQLSKEVRALLAAFDEADDAKRWREN